MLENWLSRSDKTINAMYLVHVAYTRRWPAFNIIYNTWELMDSFPEHCLVVYIVVFTPFPIFSGNMTLKLLRFKFSDDEHVQSLLSLPQQLRSSSWPPRQLTQIIMRPHHVLGMRPPVPKNLLEKAKISGTEKWGYTGEGRSICQASSRDCNTSHSAL